LSVLKRREASKKKKKKQSPARGTLPRRKRRKKMKMGTSRNPPHRGQNWKRGHSPKKKKPWTTKKKNSRKERGGPCPQVCQLRKRNDLGEKKKKKKVATTSEEPLGGTKKKRGRKGGISRGPEPWKTVREGLSEKNQKFAKGYYVRLGTAKSDFLRGGENQSRSKAKARLKQCGKPSQWKWINRRRPIIPSRRGGR